MERIGNPGCWMPIGSQLVKEANVAVMGSLFFVIVLAVSLWAMIVTVAPRLNYIAALLSGSMAAPVLAPVAQRRRVRRISPLPYRAELSLIRAAA